MDGWVLFPVGLYHKGDTFFTNMAIDFGCNSLKKRSFTSSSLLCSKNKYINLVYWQFTHIYTPSWLWELQPQELNA